MSVDLEPGPQAVVGIETAGVTAEACCLENWPSDDETLLLPNVAANGSRSCWLTRHFSADA
jgi:hypothetical protein